MSGPSDLCKSTSLPDKRANGNMKQCVFACIIAIAGWYLIYPPATYQGSSPYSHTAFSQWNVDGSYGTSADCEAAYHRDLYGLHSA